MVPPLSNYQWSCLGQPGQAWGPQTLEMEPWRISIIFVIITIVITTVVNVVNKAVGLLLGPKIPVQVRLRPRLQAV